jgi:hypothetical protein
MPLHPARTAALAALIALIGASGAAAATSSVATKPGAGAVRPIRAGTTVVAITAFPAGGKSSGTEATCELWADRLQEDEDAQDRATDKQDVIDTTETLNDDVDNALDAGCAVIYSARVASKVPGGKPHVKRTTLRPSRRRAGAVKPVHPVTTTTVAAITAFPTGGKGSATEATCALWTDRLRDDQAIIDNAPDTDKQDAAGPLEADVDNALDAGCAVLY